MLHFIEKRSAVFVYLISVFSVFLCMAFMNGCEYGETSFDTKGEVRRRAEVSFIGHEGPKGTLDVIVSDKRSEWSAGLAAFERIDYGEGMLFLFPYAQDMHFIMGGVEYPLSVIFINKEKEIDEILQLIPGEIEKARPENEYWYAVETLPEWIIDKKLESGDIMKIDGLD